MEELQGGPFDLKRIANYLRRAKSKEILEDCISSIISNTVLSCHRSEKLLRMQSAATQAESLALANLEPQSQKNANNSQPTVPANRPA